MMIKIKTNDGEHKELTTNEHQKMINEYGEDNLPYTVLIKDKPKIYGGPEPYPPGYTYKNH